MPNILIRRYKSNSLYVSHHSQYLTAALQRIQIQHSQTYCDFGSPLNAQLVALPYTRVAWLVMDVSGKSPETQKLSDTNWILEHCALKKMACTQQLFRAKQAGGSWKHLLLQGNLDQPPGIWERSFWNPSCSMGNSSLPCDPTFSFSLGKHFCHGWKVALMMQISWARNLVTCDCVALRLPLNLSQNPLIYLTATNQFLLAIFCK